MGMTIDDSIKALITERKTALHENKKAFDFAVDTMRKYQKIEQIMERTVDDGTSMYDTLQEIEEVVEDGKID